MIRRGRKWRNATRFYGWRAVAWKEKGKGENLRLASVGSAKSDGTNFHVWSQPSRTEIFGLTLAALRPTQTSRPFFPSTKSGHSLTQTYRCFALNVVTG